MEYRKVTRNELALLYNFLESLKQDDVELFWSCLSEKCKELIRTEVDFFSGKDKSEVLKMVKENFEEHLKNLGIANVIRFPGKIKQKLLGSRHQINVRTHIHYLTDVSDIPGMEIPLELENGEFKINILKQN